MSINLIDQFKNKLKTLAYNDPEREDFERLSNLNLLRSILKKSIMTIPYNVSTFQMIKYISESFIECEDLNINNTKTKDK
jgi:hypothetical protein